MVVATLSLSLSLSLSSHAAASRLRLSAHIISQTPACVPQRSAQNAATQLFPLHKCLLRSAGAFVPPPSQHPAGSTAKHTISPSFALAIDTTIWVPHVAFLVVVIVVVFL